MQIQEIESILNHHKHQYRHVEGYHYNSIRYLAEELEVSVEIAQVLLNMELKIEDLQKEINNLEQEREG